jgi:hypothetical protein
MKGTYHSCAWEQVIQTEGERLNSLQSVCNIMVEKKSEHDMLCKLKL